MSSDRCRERVRALVADPQFSSRRSLGRFDWRMSPWRAAIKVGQYVLAGRHVDRDAIIANVVDGLSDACMLSGATEVMDHGALPYVARVVCDSANGMVHAYRCKDCNGRDMTLMLVDGTVPSRYYGRNYWHVRSESGDCSDEGTLCCRLATAVGAFALSGCDDEVVHLLGEGGERGWWECSPIGTNSSIMIDAARVWGEPVPSYW